MPKSVESQAASESKLESIPQIRPYLELTDLKDLPNQTALGVKKQKNLLPNFDLLKRGELTHETVKMSNKDRDYYVYVPKSYKAGHDCPLFIVFGGASRGAGAEHMNDRTQFSKAAEEKGFIVVFLDGDKHWFHTWNSGQWEFTSNNDDFFTKTVLKNMKNDFAIDQSRVYLVGESQGASFLHHELPKLDGQIAAIADLSGWIGDDKKVYGAPAIMIHSATDPVAPYKGNFCWPHRHSQDETYELYCQANGIKETTAVSTQYKPDGDFIVTKVALQPNTVKTVEQVTIYEKEKRHIWMGATDSAPSDIDATKMVVDFCLSHPKS